MHDVNSSIHIEEILFEFTKDTNWSLKTSYTLSNLIKTLYYSLKEVGLINAEDLNVGPLIASVIVKGVNNHLVYGDGLWGGSILNEIIVFRCSVCNTLDTYEEEGICYMCLGNN